MGDGSVTKSILLSFRLIFGLLGPFCGVNSDFDINNGDNGCDDDEKGVIVDDDGWVI